MPTIVEARTASLDTLAVTIQALHVSGKQMTLAVFRQLPRKYEPTGSTLWGIVRYEIKDEGGVWLVFSHEGALYRRPVITRKRLAIPDDDLRHLRQTVSMHRRIPDWGGLAKEEERLAKLEQIFQEEKELYDLEWARDSSLLDNLPQLFIAV